MFSNEPATGQWPHFLPVNCCLSSSNLPFAQKKLSVGTASDDVYTAKKEKETVFTLHYSRLCSFHWPDQRNERLHVRLSFIKRTQNNNNKLPPSSQIVLLSLSNVTTTYSLTHSFVWSPINVHTVIISTRTQKQNPHEDYEFILRHLTRLTVLHFSDMTSSTLYIHPYVYINILF